MWCFELLALPLWYGRTVCSFCGNYLFKKLESWGWCVVSDTQEREFLFLFLFFNSILIQLHARCYISRVSLLFLVVFWWEHYIKDQTQRFLLSFSNSTCYRECLSESLNFFPQLSHQPHSSSSSCCCSSAALLNSPLSISSLFGYCTQGEFKVTLKYHTSCEVHHTCIWSQSL